MTEESDCKSRFHDLESSGHCFFRFSVSQSPPDSPNSRPDRYSFDTLVYRSGFMYLNFVATVNNLIHLGKKYLPQPVVEQLNAHEHGVDLLLSVRARSIVPNVVCISIK